MDSATGKTPLTIKFYQQDWIPGFAAFLPEATTPQGEAFCVLNLGSTLCVYLSEPDFSLEDLHRTISDSLIHEIGHALEQWIGLEFSEERVEAVVERYNAYVLREREHLDQNE